MFEPGTLVKNTDKTLKELASRDYTFRVKGVDYLGVACLEIVGNEEYGELYLFARDLAIVGPEVQEVS